MERSFNIFPFLGPMMVIGGALIFLVLLFGAISAKVDEIKENRESKKNPKFAGHRERTKFLSIFEADPYGVDTYIRAKLEEKFRKFRHQRILPVISEKMKLKCKTTPLNELERKRLEELRKEEFVARREFRNLLDLAMVCRSDITFELIREMRLGDFLEEAVEGEIVNA